MKAYVLIRIAAMVTLLYSVGHMSGYPWTPGESPASKVVVESMHSIQFEALGFTRTYREFYIGFGHIIGLFLIGLASIIWFVGDIGKHQPQGVRPLLVAVAVMFIGNAVLSWMYFFAIPAVMALVIAGLLIVSISVQRNG